MAWSDHVDQLLYDGERKQRRLEFADATVVVTTHRVLVFAEDDGGIASPRTESEMGAAYRTVDRPNVREVTVETGGSTGHLVRALVPGVLGCGLVAIGTALETTTLLPDLGGAEADGQGDGTSVDGVADVTGGLFDTVETVLSAVELAALLLGALALVAALGYLVLYLRSRSRRIVLAVSGDEDIALPITDVDIEAGIVSELEAAIRPGDELEDVDPITAPSADLDGGAGGRGVDGPTDLEPGGRDGGSGPGGDPTPDPDTDPGAGPDESG